VPLKAGFFASEETKSWYWLSWSCVAGNSNVISGSLCIAASFACEFVSYYFPWMPCVHFLFYDSSNLMLNPFPTNAQRNKIKASKIVYNVWVWDVLHWATWAVYIEFRFQRLGGYSTSPIHMRGMYCMTSIYVSHCAAVMMIGMCRRKAAHFPSHRTILMQK
jgi:hypothetical protein